MRFSGEICALVLVTVWRRTAWRRVRKNDEVGEQNRLRADDSHGAVSKR